MNFQLFTSASYSRTVAMLVLLVIAASVPLTVFIAQKQQELRQRAEGGLTASQWTCAVKRYSPLVGCTGEPTSEETYISSKNESYDSCATKTSYAVITCNPILAQEGSSPAVPIPTPTPTPIPTPIQTAQLPPAAQTANSNLAPCPEGALTGCRSEMPNIPGASFEVVPSTTCPTAGQTCYKRVFPTPTPASAVPLTPTASTPSPTPSPTPTPIPTQTIATVLIPPTSSPTPPPANSLIVSAA